MGGTIARHSCGRLVIYGQRCVCDPIPPFDCDCVGRGNDEHEGEHCRSMRAAAWAGVVNAIPTIQRIRDSKRS